MSVNAYLLRRDKDLARFLARIFSPRAIEKQLKLFQVRYHLV